MFIGVGMPHMVRLIVTNNTNKSIKCVRFLYNSDKINIKLKNIKPNQNKITGINTIYDVYNVKMVINEIKEEYLIISKINKGTFNLIEISINNFDDKFCEFDILETDKYRDFLI